MEIRGKVTILTGASDGIGLACARVLARRGAKLVLNARSADKLEGVARELGGETLAVAGDITEAATRQRLVDQTLGRFGRVDLLINNAGAGLYQPSWRAPMEEARRLFELNLFAPLALTQLVVPFMQQQGGGMIVNIGSMAGKVTLPWFTLYSSTKYALGSWTDGLRMELRKHRIHALIVCPGYVDTSFQNHILGGEVPRAASSAKSFAITPEKCAEDIVRGMEREARTIVTPKWGWLAIAAARLLPGVFERRFAKMNEKRS
jgi:short-subunit dehydrogenase